MGNDCCRFDKESLAENLGPETDRRPNGMMNSMSASAGPSQSKLNREAEDMFIR